MTEALALLVALALSRLRDPYYLDELHKLGARKAAALQEHYGTSAGFTWAALVLVPFLVLLAVDAMLHRAWPLDFAFTLAMLMFAVKFRHFNYFLERLMLALYGNDVAQTEYLSRKWGGHAVSEVSDVLRLSAERLHTDLFMPLFWFGVFGPAGLYLGLAHVVAGRIVKLPPHLDRALCAPAEVLTVLLTALAGNFGPAFSKIFGRDAVPESMVLSSGVNPKRVDIERVPGYRRLVERVLIAEIAFTALLLFLRG